MKKIIALIGLAALCAGCSNSNDTVNSAKLDELSKKIDVLEHNQAVAVTNEFVLYREIATLNAEVTNLPSYDQMNNTMHFYYTNQVDLVASLAQTENTVNGVWGDLLKSQMTNRPDASGDDAANLLNARMQSDIEQIHDDVEDIKVRLNIP